MKILVATITHRADDARIFARQLPALLQAGHEVTVIAPWTASATSPAPEISAVNVPRTRGLHRTWALVRALFAISTRARSHHAILVHDPELAFALSLLPFRGKCIWDVHEDVPAALRSKSYLRFGRNVLSGVVSRLERRTEKHMRLILAEERYVDRFAKPHPVILNLPRVAVSLSEVTPKPRVVYVGSITRARGLEMMLKAAEILEVRGISLLLIGEIPAHTDQALVRSARNTTWMGPLPNAQALREVEESLAGLSLLADLPNYRHSMPTKILEYMSRGVPVISTPLSLAQAALAEHGFMVSFDPDKGAKEVAEAAIELLDNPEKRNEIRSAAFARVSRNYNWEIHQADFVGVFSEG